MKKKLFTFGKILLGILFIILPFVIIVFLVDDIFRVYNYSRLKWIALLICFSGFYISGLINRNTKIIFVPFLYISLLIFIPMRCFYNPLTYYLILFATISLLITRKEIRKKIKITLASVMGVLFVYLLFSQPLILVKGEIEKTNQYGDLLNGKTIWNFTKEKSKLLPETIFSDANGNDFDLNTLENKKIYVSFWATWCAPCHIEKPELEKLKNEFRNDDSVVFVDISLDEDTNKWKDFITKNTQSGIQLISKDIPNTRNLFELPGIPQHLVINTKKEYGKARIIDYAYKLLKDSTYLNLFIHKKLKKSNANKIDDYVKLDSVSGISGDTVYYTSNYKNRYTAYHLNRKLDTIKQQKKYEFAKLLIAKKPLKNRDSTIYHVMYLLEKDKTK